MRSVLIFVLICSAVTLLSLSAAPDEKKLPHRTPTHAAGSPIRTKFNINRISAWYDSDGTEERNSATGNAGLIYPNGTAGAIFTAGLVWSGIHNDGMQPALRANGSAYITGLGRGAILGTRTGVRED